MSEYEYDTGATRLVISEGLNIRDDKKLAIVSAEHLEGANIAVAVQAEDAPAVALAILEAAGIEPSNTAECPEGVALEWLDVWRKTRKDKAEREAEDAKVVEFHTAIGANLNRIERHNRDLYNAARRFFEGDAKPEPRVLNHGDPEPLGDTKWRDTRGNIWYHGYSCHRDYPVWQFESASGSSFGRWGHLDACFFPMTEVTP